MFAINKLEISKCIIQHCCTNFWTYFSTDYCDEESFNGRFQFSNFDMDVGNP